MRIMHGARIRTDRCDCLLHCYNRVAGWKDDYLFGEVEKERMFQLAQWLQKFYSVDIISFVCMSNHWHAIICTHPELPNREEVKRRFRAFYTDDRIEPNWNDDAVVAKYAARMRDISCFIKDLQQRFTCWFNRTHKRRGRLWADRYKSVVIEDSEALWECLKYLEMNPVRAGICTDPADYRFSTWGRYCGSGRHPFARAFEKHVGACLSIEGHTPKFKEIAALLRSEMARVAAAERRESVEEIAKAQEKARRGVSFELRLMRRVRYWTDGAIIGSKEFVRDFACEFFGSEQVKDKRLKRSCSMNDKESGIYSFRHLRTTPSY
jgi:putative transposase